MIRNAHPALSLRFWSHCCRWRSGDGWWATERLWKRQHCSHHTTDAVSRCSHANTCVLFVSSEAIIQAKTPTYILFYMLGVCASDHTIKRVIVSHECCEPCTRCGQRKRGKQAALLYMIRNAHPRVQYLAMLPVYWDRIKEQN